MSKDQIPCIHDGNKTLALTDDLFFELLSKDPAFLATTTFQERISEWRDLCYWPELYRKKDIAAARANILKIGRVLAKSRRGPGTPARLRQDEILWEYKERKMFLEKFFAETCKNPSSKLLTKTYPQWKEAFHDEAGWHNHRSVKEIAIRLTKFLLASREKPLLISLKTLRKIIQ